MCFVFHIFDPLQLSLCHPFFSWVCWVSLCPLPWILYRIDCLFPLLVVFFFLPEVVPCSFIWNLFLSLLILPNSLCLLYILSRPITFPVLGEEALWRPMGPSNMFPLGDQPFMWASWCYWLQWACRLSGKAPGPVDYWTFIDSSWCSTGKNGRFQGSWLWYSVGQGLVPACYWRVRSWGSWLNKLEGSRMTLAYWQMVPGSWLAGCRAQMSP